MFFKNHTTRLMILSIVLGGSATVLNATYYQPDFFPIGLTGLNYTGPDMEDNCPYSNVEEWTWDIGDQSEKTLIEALGVNVIGCQDAYPRYLIAWGDTNTPISSRNNYLCKICRPTIVDADPTNNIYLITASYRTSLYRDYWHECSTSPDSIRHKGNDDIRASVLFRSFKRGGGYGYYLFDPAGNPNSFPDCIGTDTDNWNTCDGDTVWQKMADTAVITIEKYFQKYTSDNIRECIWGYNLISEDPAVYRRTSSTPAWHGVWAAVDRVFTGHKYTTSQFKDLDTASHSGIRGAEDNVGMSHRMFTAKCETYPLHKSNYNIFQYLPDLDVIVNYLHCWCYADWNYGDQKIFERLLYDYHSPSSKQYMGYHNTAIYMQQYGNTPGGPSGQKRRWIAAFTLEWRMKEIYEEDSVYTRRPCPPEIRCATYLSLSRGAKGILWHPWLSNYEQHEGFTFESDEIKIPQDKRPGWSEGITVGLRDQQGYPFGYSGGGTHYLNNSVGTTHWHTNRNDYTYYYLDTLITEIKLIAPKLMELDWVNAYSLKSTDPEWASPCPHYYVDTVITTGSGYIDLGFFEPHSPWWDYGKYLMVVNRDGIAQVDTATITLVLDFPTGSRLSVIEIGDPDSFYVLTKSGGYFYLVKDYAPGEGKLFRFYPIKEDDKPKLNLRGECKGSAVASGFTQSLSGGGNPVAVLTWEWMNYKPWDLTKMELWKQNPYDTEWVCAVDTHPTDRRAYTFTHPMPCDSCCVRFLEVGYHVSGDTITWPTELEGVVGTKSNMYMVCCPNDYGGCPDLYTFFYQDTAVSPGHVFIENNTILPHSEHYQQMDEDLLRLDVLNDSPDHYYMAIVENDDEASYLDQAKLWVVDHNEGTQVVTSADDSIYVYSEMAAPTYCKDNGNNDRLDEVLWEDTLSYGGPEGSYLIVKFDEVEWAYTGLLLRMGNWESGPTPAPKNYLSVPQKPGEGGRWDSLGVAYGRMNHSRWMVDVSDVDSLVFRIMCKGNDTTFIDRIALVKLEGSGWSKQEAALGSAVKHYPPPQQGEIVTSRLTLQDTLIVNLNADRQISLCFNKVDSSTTYSLRDFVLQSRGYYSTTSDPPLGIEEAPLQFGLRVEQLTPLSRIAFINYSVPYATHVKIAAYDVVGRLIKCIVDEEVKAGRYSEEWKGKDDAGRTLASGIYFVKMMTEDFEKTTKIVILE